MNPDTIKILKAIRDQGNERQIRELAKCSAFDWIIGYFAEEFGGGEINWEEVYDACKNGIDDALAEEEHDSADHPSAPDMINRSGCHGGQVYGI